MKFSLNVIGQTLSSDMITAQSDFSESDLHPRIREWYDKHDTDPENDPKLQSGDNPNVAFFMGYANSIFTKKGGAVKHKTITQTVVFMKSLGFNKGDEIFDNSLEKLRKVFLPKGVDDHTVSVDDLNLMSYDDVKQYEDLSLVDRKNRSRGSVLDFIMPNKSNPLQDPHKLFIGNKSNLQESRFWKEMFGDKFKISSNAKNWQAINPKLKKDFAEAMIETIQTNPEVEFAVTSAHRPGSVTKSGHKSRHGDAKAIDITIKKDGAWDDSAARYFVKALHSKGYSVNKESSRKYHPKAVLYKNRGGTDHLNHIHISNVV
jgi:hypothetical protein